MSGSEREPLGIDLRLESVVRAGSALRLALVARPAGIDLDVVTGRDNLAQAIWLRLALARGDLEHLGHARFGSRLHLLIGRRLTPSTIALAKAYVREALRDEPRIERIEALEVGADPRTPNVLLVSLRVVPNAATEPLDLGFGLPLDGVGETTVQG